MTGNIFGTNMSRWDLVRLLDAAAQNAWDNGDRTLEKMFERFAGQLSSGGEHLLLDDVQYELERDPEFYNDLLDYLPRNVVDAIAN